jgi:hypothetical protein
VYNCGLADRRKVCSIEYRVSSEEGKEKKYKKKIADRNSVGNKCGKKRKDVKSKYQSSRRTGISPVFFYA